MLIKKNKYIISIINFYMAKNSKIESCSRKKKFNEASSKAKKAVSKASKKAKKEIDEVKDAYNSSVNSIKNKTNSFLDNIKENWRFRYGKNIAERPDLRFMLDIILGIIFIVVLQKLFLAFKDIKFYIYQNLKNTKNVDNVPLEKLNPAVFRKEKTREESIRAHDLYYRLKPFGTMTKDDETLMKHVDMILKIGIYFMIYFGIPFIIAYLVWLFFTYTPDFIRAALGYFKTMFRFFVRLVEAAASRVWIIRTILGWGILPFPNILKEHILPWKRAYIDTVIDREMLRYKLLWLRILEKYYYRPKRIYIEIPWANLKRWFKKFKKYHVDLTFKEFWIQIVKFYPQFISRPENELYKRIHGMDALKNKFYNELKSKIDESQRCATTGKSGYESKTSRSKKKCYCPPKTGNKCGKVLGKIGETASELKSTGKKATAAMGVVGDEVSKNLEGPVKDVSDKLLGCEDNEDPFDNIGMSIKTKFISKIPIFIFRLIMFIVVLLLLFILYGRIFDVPNFMKPYVYPKLSTIRRNGKLIPVTDRNILTSLFNK